MLKPKGCGVTIFWHIRVILAYQKTRVLFNIEKAIFFKRSKKKKMGCAIILATPCREFSKKKTKFPKHPWYTVFAWVSAKSVFLFENQKTVVFDVIFPLGASWKRSSSYRTYPPASMIFWSRCGKCSSQFSAACLTGPLLRIFSTSLLTEGFLGSGQLRRKFCWKGGPCGSKHTAV